MKVEVVKQKKCKNKECQKLLPYGYKHAYCESCLNKKIEKAKKVGTGAVSILGTVGIVIVGIVTKGKITIKKG